MAFVGPHHGLKILGKNHQSTTKVTLNEPPMNLTRNRFFAGTGNFECLCVHVDLPCARSLREGAVFSCVCPSVH